MTSIILGAVLGVFATLFVEMAVIIGWSYTTFSKKGCDDNKTSN